MNLELEKNLISDVFDELSNIGQISNNVLIDNILEIIKEYPEPQGEKQIPIICLAFVFIQNAKQTIELYNKEKIPFIVVRNKIPEDFEAAYTAILQAEEVVLKING